MNRQLGGVQDLGLSWEYHMLSANLVQLVCLCLVSLEHAMLVLSRGVRVT